MFISGYWYQFASPSEEEKQPPLHPIEGACMVDCLHVDDLAAILAEKGLDKRPLGKYYPEQ